MTTAVANCGDLSRVLPQAAAAVYLRKVKSNVGLGFIGIIKKRLLYFFIIKKIEFIFSYRYFPVITRIL